MNESKFYTPTRKIPLWDDLFYWRGFWGGQDSLWCLRVWLGDRVMTDWALIWHTHFLPLPILTTIIHHTLLISHWASLRKYSSKYVILFKLITIFGSVLLENTYYILLINTDNHYKSHSTHFISVLGFTTQSCIFLLLLLAMMLLISNWLLIKLWILSGNKNGKSLRRFCQKWDLSSGIYFWLKTINLTKPVRLFKYHQEPT